jgi:deazaflavin-dependent oxidoreductase (nitroreductase family)
MNPLAKAFNAVGGTIMVRTGKVARLGTTGSKSGRPRSAAVGYLRRADGTVLVGAGGPGRAWAANLRAHPACTLQVTGTTRSYAATGLAGADLDAAAAELTASMPGFMSSATWTEVFVLRPADPASSSAPPAAGSGTAVGATAGDGPTRGDAR